MTEQAAREAFYAWVDRLPITTAVSEVPSTKVWLAAWAACEARTDTRTTQEVVDLIQQWLDGGHTYGPASTMAVRKLLYWLESTWGVGAVRVAREGQDGD